MLNSEGFSWTALLRQRSMSEHSWSYSDRKKLKSNGLALSIVTFTLRPYGIDIPSVRCMSAWTTLQTNEFFQLWKRMKDTGKCNLTRGTRIKLQLGPVIDDLDIEGCYVLEKASRTFQKPIAVVLALLRTKMFIVYLSERIVEPKTPDSISVELNKYWNSW